MRLLDSLTFRLTLLYAALFGLSVAALGGLYFWLAIRGPMDAVREGLRAEAGGFAIAYRDGGAEALARMLERRAGEPSPRAGYHALLDPRGRTVTANLPSWPHGFAGGWVRIEADVARDGDEDDHEALVYDRRLEDGSRLLIGRDIEDLDELEEAITGTLAWLIPALALLGLIGGAFMSRAVGRRIERVSEAARSVIAGDLSKRIKLRGSGDDFDRLAATLNLMLERIEEALEAVRRVSDSVAHELRTPLTRLQASLAELQSRSDAPLVAEAVQEAERLQKTFETVLRISRIEAGRHEAAAIPVDLSALLADAAELYQPEAEARGQRLAAEIEPGLSVRGDRDLLFQALANLLDNAVKFTPEGGEISLRGAAKPDGILVTVSDSGPGIPAELHDRVTERFYRTPEASGTPGLGLGLALASAVAAFHRSSLRFHSAEPGLRVEWRFEADT